MSILAGTAGAPLIATREYTFFLREQPEGSVLWMSTRHRGTWDDFGEAERPEQEAWMRSLVRELGVTTVPPDYPGSFCFANVAARDTVLSALESKLQKPLQSAPIATRTFAAHGDLGPRFLELVKHVIGCYSLEKAGERWHCDNVWVRIEPSSMSIDPRYDDPRDVRITVNGGEATLTVSGVLDAEEVAAQLAR